MREQAIKNLGSICEICSQADIDVLEIHHRYHNGNIDRRQRTPYQILCTLARGEELEFFQLLCANCHRKVGKGIKIERLQKHNTQPTPQSVAAVAKAILQGALLPEKKRLKLRQTRYKKNTILIRRDGQDVEVLLE